MLHVSNFSFSVMCFITFMESLLEMEMEMEMETFSQRLLLHGSYYPISDLISRKKNFTSIAILYFHSVQPVNHPT